MASTRRPSFSWASFGRRSANRQRVASALERAIDQFGADSSGEARARLHLGRVLLESERDRARAVSECRLATERDPELVAAWFWLGRALAELVKHETAAEASAALRTYLVLGAPLGRRSEVRELLGVMAGNAAPRARSHSRRGNPPRGGRYQEAVAVVPQLIEPRRRRGVVRPTLDRLGGTRTHRGGAG